MARPLQNRKVQIPPRFKGFIPLDYYGSKSEYLSLLIEEYEAIRLLDYENLSQAEAAFYIEVLPLRSSEIFN